MSDDEHERARAATAGRLQEQLATVPLFARCHPGDLHVVARRCEVREVPNNTVLIRAGDIGDELFVLISGTAERRLPGDHVRAFGPGDYFGELAILDPAACSLDVVTTSDCLVGVLSRASFLLVLDAVPGVWSQMLTFLARRLREADLREDYETELTRRFTPRHRRAGLLGVEEHRVPKLGGLPPRDGGDDVRQHHRAHGRRSRRQAAGTRRLGDGADRAGEEVPQCSGPTRTPTALRSRRRSRPRWSTATRRRRRAGGRVKPSVLRRASSRRRRRTDATR